MSIQVKEISNRRDLSTFIYLPEELHRDHSNWIPPLYADEWVYFDPKKNPAFSYCDTTLALAYRDGQTCGRIMGIINHRFNESHGQKTGRFAYLESVDDEAVSNALLRHVEEWAAGRGMNRIVGPLGFSDQDPEGFMIEGFDVEPTPASYQNQAYIIPFLERRGYGREVDYVVYQVPVNIPDIYDRIYDRITARKEFQLEEFENKRRLKSLIVPVLRLMNETYGELYGYESLEEEEMFVLAKRYFPVLDPRFIKVVTREGEVVAFVLGIPNMNEGLRRSRGRLWPFGVFHILKARKRATQLDLLLGAIKEEYRGRGLDVLMGTAMMRSARKAGIRFMDSHHEMESNLKVRAEMERAGGVVYKRFRIFSKDLTAPDAGV